MSVLMVDDRADDERRDEQRERAVHQRNQRDDVTRQPVAVRDHVQIDE